MRFTAWIERERILWHEHFLPSLLAGLVVAFLSAVFQMTVANIVLFASVGASATILTNSHYHHLTKLHTTIVAYVVAIFCSLGIFAANQYYVVPMAVNIFLVEFVVGMGLYMFNSFHPPAITAALSFLLLQREVIDLVYLFIAIIFLLIAIRFMTYTLSQHLSVKKFFREFVRSF